MKITDVINPEGAFASEIATTFRDLGVKVRDVNVANGWDTSRGMLAAPEQYDERWQVAHKIAELGLISTEVSEAIEDVRAGRPMNELTFREDGKPEGVPSELADIVIRVLDIADAYGVDLGEALVAKLNHNATRGLHHGGKAL